MRNRDFVFGSATLILAALYYALTITIPRSDLADPIGPQGLPLAVGAVALAFIAIVFWEASAKPKA